MHLDRRTAYLLRAALIAALRMIEEALGLRDAERALKPTKKERGADTHG
jgi:hypothetical protein